MRQLGNKKKFLIVLFLLIVTVGALVSYRMWFVFFASNTDFDEDYVEIKIPTGSDYKSVFALVSPYIGDIGAFERVVEWYDYPEQVKGGNFVIKKGMNNSQILKALRYTNKPVKITFNNLQTLQEFAGNISHQIEPDSVSILRAVLDTTFLVRRKLNDDNCLAVFIPNTYEFFWNTTAEKFRDRMLSEYDKFWDEKRTQLLDRVDMSKIEVIILASIVQKESLKEDEQQRLAGVYVNRLKQNILLQADPTVVYALKKQKNDFSLAIRRVLFKDLRVESPYNTYKNKGLPPGPIVTPDIHVIDAVLNYEKHDYIFFIADYENYGYHIFSETLKQHNAKRRQYIRWLNKKGIRR